MVPDESAKGDNKANKKQKVRFDELHLSLEMCKVKGLFNKIVEVFCDAIGAGSGVIRPMPPILGDGKRVDLFRLFLAVREIGRYEMVSKSGLWNSIGEISGLGCGVGASVKLIYYKYLLDVEKLLARVDGKESFKGDLTQSGKEIGSVLSEVKEALEGLLSFIEDEKKKNTEVDILSLLFNGDGGEWLNKKEKKTVTNADEDVDVVDHTNKVMDVDPDGVQNLDDSTMNIDCKFGSEVPNVQASKDNVAEKGSTGRKKRKRKSMMGMLNWLITTAKNTSAPATSRLPEISKWKSYGNHLPWKQVLSVRNDLFFNQKFDTKADQNYWLKMKMTPSMYEEGIPLFSRKFMSRDSDGNDGTAVLPECGSFVPENESKWQGTLIWPLDKTEKIDFHERVPIGRGRQEECGCPKPGSVECVRFHISEKSARLKPELGSAFRHWQMDDMGENNARNWTSEEEKKFLTIVRKHQKSEDLLKNLLTAFPTRSRGDIVRYYFNVYILRHRAEQNRSTLCYIDSDIEDSKRKKIAHPRYPRQKFLINSATTFQKKQKNNTNK